MVDLTSALQAANLKGGTEGPFVDGDRPTPSPFVFPALEEGYVMSEAKQGDTVKVHYSGSLEDGTVFDTSEDRDPLEFTIGEGQVIPGFESAVVGMEPGQSKVVTLEPGEAYGPRRSELLVEVERDRFPSDMDVEVGSQVQVKQQDGSPRVATIARVGDDSVTLDVNHPLAGKDLTFDIELVEIGS
jgi:FKBP-type peptidyl-prolyl cis-trans isomerase 2